MAPKKTNIKIKRSKINLYNKKKSKRRQALTIIITVVAICGLGVLGYGLGKPLLKYIQDRGNSSQADSETSALLSSIMNGASSETPVSTEAQVSSEPTSEPTLPLTITEKIYYLPENAALSEASLASALAEAKKSGCSVVAVTLKDTVGHLLYKTSIAEVKDTATVTGTLTASQIAQAISKEGLTPAARINTLMDQLGAVEVKGNYTFPPEQGGYRWNDDKDEKGGKPWMSPFKTESITYIGNIANELSAAGYKDIICVNTRYPAFHSIDISTYLNHLPLTDSTKRVAALWSIVDAAKTSAEKNGAEIWLEISATSLIAEKRDCTDAELIADKEKLKGVKIAVNYDIATKTTGSSGNTSNPSTTSSPNTSNTSGSTSSTSNTSGASNTSSKPDTSGTSQISGRAYSSSGESAYYQNAKNFAVKAKAALSGAEFAVRLPQTLTGTALEDVKRALEEEDITVF